MEYLNYKGFIGNVEPSKTHPGKLCGKVLGLDQDPYIRFEGDNLSDLQTNFETLIDRLAAEGKLPEQK